MKPCLGDPSHSVSDETGWTTSFANQFRGKTRINNCCRVETRQTSRLVNRDEAQQMRPFLIGPRDGSQKERLHDGEGRRLETGWAMMLVDRRETRLPSEVPRHSVLTESWHKNIELRPPRPRKWQRTQRQRSSSRDETSEGADQPEKNKAALGSTEARCVEWASRHKNVESRPTRPRKRWWSSFN